ncbi:MAG: DUF4468 domain-containing protein [Prevotella sp.]|jgi:colicin import membrane protein|nr:DUF4468 domain-containing protein [Prevotella sp.]
MKRIVLAMMMCLPMATIAQDNTWEQTSVAESGKSNPDAKYLAGAVPLVNGKVLFETTIEAPGKSKKEIYDILLAEMTKMTKEANQFEQSRIVLADEENNKQVVASYQEWLVFKNKPLVLDRTRLFYHLIAEIQDGKATIKMTRIYYLYDEERQPTTYQAEEWITDKYGLNKKMTKPSRVSGKFRRKTIDRKDFIFNKFQQLLNK